MIADDPQCVETLLPALNDGGFRASVASSGASAARMLSQGVDVVILDSSLSEPAGPLCELLRRSSHVPILVLPPRQGAADPVGFLDLGADDYLPRLDRTRELVARLRAVLRRNEEWVPPAAAPTEQVVSVGAVVLNATRHQVSVDGVDVHLPLKQFELLAFLLSNAGRVVSRRSIIDQVWQGRGRPEGSSVEVQVKRLRQKVEGDPARPLRIKTVRGVGYMYALDADPD